MPPGDLRRLVEAVRAAEAARYPQVYDYNRDRLVQDAKLAISAYVLSTPALLDAWEAVVAYGRSMRQYDEAEAALIASKGEDEALWIESDRLRLVRRAAADALRDVAQALADRLAAEESKP